MEDKTLDLETFMENAKPLWTRRRANQTWFLAHESSTQLVGEELHRRQFIWR